MSKTQFYILLEPEAMDDIQSAIDFYDQKQIGLGKKFEKELNIYLILKKKLHTLISDTMMCIACP